MGIPIILDCDPGSDDAIAMMMALGREGQIDLRCVSTVAGNQTIEKTTRNALRLLELMERDIPVVQGATGPLIRPLETAADVHGESGLDGPQLPEAKGQAVNVRLLDYYADIIDSQEGKVTFVLIGPQTNMALFLLARPDLKEKIDRIIFMGGACFGGNRTLKAEFNIYVDPEAAQIVANAGIPLVMCGLDVTHKAIITPQEIEEFRSLGNRSGVVLAELLDFYTQRAEPAFLKEEEGPLIPLHDVVAIAYLLRPDIFLTRELFVSIDRSESPVSRGATIVDYQGRSGSPANMTVCFDINRDAFIQDLLQAVKTLP